MWDSVAAVPGHVDSGRRAIARLSPRLLRAASDERLVALTRSGVDAAFEAIYDRYHRHLLSFCRHMLGSHAEGEDAVQQTFLSAHGALLGSDRPVQLRAWLHAIARNRCISTLRARREEPADDSIEPSTAGLADVVQRREDLRDLLADLATLPEQQRAALVLAELGALGHDEIATVLGVPRVKVKALVFQARESLIASRRARDTDCREIREQLATLTGGALRRAPLRRHLAVCDGCRAYKAEVARQRHGLALVLPVVPSAALKQAVLSGAGAGAGGGAAAAGAGGGVLAAGAKGVAVKVAVTAAVAATAAGGTIVAVEDRAPARTDTPVATATATAAQPPAAPAWVAVRAPVARPQRAAAQPRPRRAPAVRPRPHGAATPAAPARRASTHPTTPTRRASTHPTAPGRSATTPSRTGATPGQANPVPGVPRGQARGHAQVPAAKPVKAKPVKVHPAKPVKAKPVKVHPATPVKSKPVAATQPHGQSAEPHGKGQAASDH